MHHLLSIISIYRLWLLATLFIPLSLHADSVVLASNVATYPVGRVISTAQPVRLSPGQRLKLLTGAGRTLILEGAYQGPVEDEPVLAGDRKVAHALARLLRRPDRDRANLGAVRGTVGPSVESQAGGDVLMVDLSRSGRYCYAPGQRILIPRPPGVASDRFVLEDLDRGRRATLAWDATGRPVAWPASLPKETPMRVLARVGVLGGPVKIELQPLEFTSGDVGAQAVRLLREGCTDQARSLVRRLAGEDDREWVPVR